MKICHKCEESKELDQFPINQTRVDGRSETCLVCKREYNRLHYKQNKQYYVDKAAQARVRLRELVRAKKLACIRCGESHVATLEFHHTDPEQKDFTISKAVQGNWSTSRILAEIEKCEVLCSNCHRKLHWDVEH